VAGHARSVVRFRQCRDRQLDPLAWLARAVVVLFSEPVCSSGLICGLEARRQTGAGSAECSKNANIVSLVNEGYDDAL
jgi:hypothetical protein